LPDGRSSALVLAIMRRVHVEQLAGNAIGSLDDNFVIVEWTAEVGDHWIAPLHVHHEDDEAWYVLSGTLGFRLDDEEVEAHAGSAVLARRGTAHTFWNAGPGEARYLLVMTPRIARLVEEIHSPGADVAAIFAAHKSLLVPGR
jgi:mannose-6-phosphate isomerase-like protein (cupin superfamily)